MEAVCQVTFPVAIKSLRSSFQTPSCCELRKGQQVYCESFNRSVCTNRSMWHAPARRIGPPIGSLVGGVDIQYAGFSLRNIGFLPPRPSRKLLSQKQQKRRSPSSLSFHGWCLASAIMSFHAALVYLYDLMNGMLIRETKRKLVPWHCCCSAVDILRRATMESSGCR